MNILSLFDGISCARVALERAGFQVDNYFASEIDKYAIKVSQSNYPDICHVGDIKDLNGKQFPKIDLLIGGSPCQGFSSAGKQLNFEDPRSKLFFEFVRLLDEVKPKYFLLENVRMKKEYRDIISEYLGVQPILINSALVSAQNRNRLYWTNIPNLTQPEDCGIMLKDIVIDGEVDRDKSYCIDANYGKGISIEYYLRKKRRQIVFTEDEKGFRKLYPSEVEELQTLDKDYTNHVSKMQRFKMMGNAFTVDVIVHILKGMEIEQG